MANLASVWGTHTCLICLSTLIGTSVNAEFLNVIQGSSVKISAAV